MHSYSSTVASIASTAESARIAPLTEGNVERLGSEVSHPTDADMLSEGPTMSECSNRLEEDLSAMENRDPCDGDVPSNRATEAGPGPQARANSASPHRSCPTSGDTSCTASECFYICPLRAYEGPLEPTAAEITEELLAADDPVCRDLMPEFEAVASSASGASSTSSSSSCSSSSSSSSTSSASEADDASAADNASTFDFKELGEALDSFLPPMGDLRRSTGAHAGCEEPTNEEPTNDGSASPSELAVADTSGDSVASVSPAVPRPASGHRRTLSMCLCASPLSDASHKRLKWSHASTAAGA